MALLNNQEYLFVYGTLQSTYTNEYAVQLRTQATYISRAFCFGTVIQIDWYPGLIVSTNSEQKVFGELYALPANNSLLHILDEYENTADQEFLRTQIQVFTEHEEFSAWAYVYNKKIES